MALANTKVLLETVTTTSTSRASYEANIKAINEIAKDCAAMIVELKDAAQADGLGEWADAERTTMPSTKAYQAIESNGHSDLTKLEIRGILKFKAWNLKVSTFPKFAWFK